MLMADIPRMIRAILDQSSLDQNGLADEIGVSQGTVSRWLNGNATPKWNQREKIEGLLLRLKLSHLAGSAPPEDYVVAVVGHVGLGEEVIILDGATEQELELISLPLPLGGASCKALMARGNSQYPRVKNGEVVLFRRSDIAPAEMIGEEAIVQVIDGPVLLKTIRRGSAPGLFNLESHNAPLRENVALEWAGEILSIIPAGKWKPLIS